jgi:hypothetical protein
MDELGFLGCFCVFVLLFRAIGLYLEQIRLVMKGPACTPTDYDSDFPDCPAIDSTEDAAALAAGIEASLREAEKKQL